MVFGNTKVFLWC